MKKSIIVLSMLFCMCGASFVSADVLKYNGTPFKCGTEFVESYRINVVAISSEKADDLSKKINEWLNQHKNVNIVSIQYDTCCGEKVTYSVLITYIG